METYRYKSVNTNRLWLWQNRIPGNHRQMTNYKKVWKRHDRRSSKMKMMRELRRKYSATKQNYFILKRTSYEEYCSYSIE